MWIGRRKLILTAFLLFTVGALCLLKEPMEMMTVQPARIGDRLPSLPAETLDGEKTTIDLTGRFSYIVFFKINCIHCRNQLKNAEELMRMPGLKGLHVVAIAKSYHEELPNLPYAMPTYIDHSSVLTGRLGRMRVPTVMITDRAGYIRHIRSAYRPIEQDHKLLNDLIPGRSRSTGTATLR